MFYELNDRSVGFAVGDHHHPKVIKETLGLCEDQWTITVHKALKWR